MLDLVTLTWFNNFTYCPQQDVLWYYSNKIYKTGRICVLSVDVDTRNCTVNENTTRARIFQIIDLQFRPICVCNDAVNNNGIGFIFSPNGEVWIERDIVKYPTWADIYDTKYGTGGRIYAVYLSRQ